MSLFSERLKLLRKQSKLSQRQLGLTINSSEATIQSYELSLRTPSIEIAIALAEYFDVPTDYLLGAGLYKHAEQIEEHYDYIKNFISNIIIDEKPNLIEDYIQNLDACENIVDRIALLSIFIKKISFDNNEIRIHLKLYK